MTISRIVKQTQQIYATASRGERIEFYCRIDVRLASEFPSKVYPVSVKHWQNGLINLR